MPILNGSSYASYVVRLSRAAAAVITIPWSTQAGTAAPGEDYEQTSGTIVFAPGETEKAIQVLVYGRAAGDTAPRDFGIKLTPTPGVILAAETVKAIIEVVNENGATIAAVTVATGPVGKSAYEIARVQGFEGTAAEWIASLKGEPGTPGTPGAPGLSAFEIAVALGFAGTSEEWLETLRGEPGIDGASAFQLAVTAGFTGSQAEWFTSLRGQAGGDGLSAYALAVENGHFEGTEAQWLASLKGEPGDPGTPGGNGDDGDDGRTVEIQRGATHLQWRYVGTLPWTNIVPLADLKGDAGTGLTNRGDWAASTFQPGDYVFSAGSSAATSMWILRGDVPYVSATAPAGDVANWIEFEAPAGPAGDDGAEGKAVEIQKSATHVQWRHVGDATWTNLVALADLKGDPGIQGNPGTAGPAIELQKSATHVQWRVVGQTVWVDLVALADLAGTAGAAGAKWLTGAVAPVAGTGVQGDFYLNTATGDVYGPKGASAWGAIAGNIKGTAGSAGAAGAKWLVGAGVPAAGTGVQNDFYLNATTGDVYGPKGASAWGAIAANIKGAAGAPGSGGGGSSGVTALRATDLGVTEITLVDALSFDVVANTVYSVTIHLLYRATDIAKGIRVGFGGNAGVQSFAVACRSFDSAGASVGKYLRARATPVVFATSAFSGDDNIITIEGTLFVTGAGTFTLQIGAGVQYDYCAAQKGTLGVLTPIGTIAA